MAKKGLPTREQDYSARYNELVEKADLAQKSDVRGCMVIKPYGYAIWENIKTILDRMFKTTGHQNAYFPLFIPKSYLSKEADHVEGFAKECAVVTHHRLMSNPDGEGVMVDPEAKLEEELIVRPTSETIIRKTYQDWITSYRDLPILVNQWANVVRWEMRTRIFLRTAEFLWQEGHTAHATEVEARQEADQMLAVYDDLMTNYLAISGVKGRKSPSERFAGAEDTLTIEALMQDGKALQSCTSHFLGQNFAKAFDVKFMNEQQQEEHVWATSWGMSTRIMGGLIMSHSDDRGLVLPPAIAPTHVVIVPIFKTTEDLEEIKDYLSPVLGALDKMRLSYASKYYVGEQAIRYTMDDDDHKSPGRKFTEREMKGVPLRLTIGKRDMEKGVIEIVRRDTGDKQTIAIADAATTIATWLDDMQTSLLAKNQQRRHEHTHEVTTWEDFQEHITSGFVLAYRDGTPETEEAIKQATKATIRCLPFEEKDAPAGTCIYSGKPATQKALFARAY